MKKLNVLLLIDSYGWAFDFGARGIQKYSKHNCSIKSIFDVTYKDVISNDVIFAFSATMWNSFIMKPTVYYTISKKKRRCCVGMRASPKIATPIPITDLIDAIACQNKEIYYWNTKREKEIKSKVDEFAHLQQRKLYLVYSGVDDEIFKPVERPKERFVVGWCGNKDWNVKRFRLLSKLKFLVVTKTERHLVKGISQEPMAKWYNTLDAFVHVSEMEGFPQPILEAMSSGLPIVSTTVGGNQEVIDKKWLVPVYPESEVIKQVNEKLQLLKDDYELRLRVGRRNRQKVLKKWSWRHIVKRYDEMFEGK